MTLSDNAIKDLRTALRKSYGEDFDVALADKEIENIGLFILTGLVESLKIEMTNKLSQL